ncbi:hypothetical protein ACRN9Z_16335 [Shewanella frigidimarina]|jgi:hypothetical protein|nr:MULTISPECIES: hypothetical protein [unclassified Shewanella]MBB1390084.1 hypothetical protein [Shewanella sp. SG44-6]
MKLITLGLGVVAGIYLSLEYPDVAMQVLNSFIDFINWLSFYVASMLRGI